MISQREEVDVLNDAPQGAVRVSGVQCRTPGNVLIPQELHIRILLPTFSQDTRLVRRQVHPDPHIRIGQSLLPEPFEYMSHVLLHRVKCCLTVHLVKNVNMYLPLFIDQSYLVRLPDMNTDNRMLKLEVFLSCLEHGLEVWLGSQDELEDL